MRYIYLLLILFYSNQFVLSQENELKKINILYKKGNEFLNANTLEDAKIEIVAGLKLSQEFQIDSLIAKGNYYLGEYFYKEDSYEDSEVYFNKALEQYKTSSNSHFISLTNRKLGSIYRKRSNFEKALFYNYESLKVNESLNNEIEVATDLNEIASIYSRTRDFKAAETRLNEALKINRKSSNLKGIVDNLSNLGAVAQRTEKFDKAIAYYKEGIQYADSLNLLINKSIYLGNIGSTYRSVKKYNQSLEYLFKALQLKKDIHKTGINRKGSIAHTCNDISETYIELKNYQKAREFALEAIKYAKNESLELERYGYYLLSKSNFELGNYKSSYSDLEKYNELNDSIFNINKASAINELNIKYDTEKRKNTIQQQESAIELLDAQNAKKKQQMLFGGISLAALFGFLLLYRSRNSAKKRKLIQEKFTQDLLVAQEQERSRISKDLHDSVGQQLTLIKKKAQKESLEEISYLTNEALEEVRSISRDLYPANLQQLGLSTSIEQMLYSLDEETNIFFTVEVDNIDQELNEEKTLNFYRFIQESVNNVIKHANAKALSVYITKKAAEIEAVIKDNGQGFENVYEKRENSLGLKTMAERIQILQGTLSIKSKKEQGTTVTAIIPL